MANFRKSFSFRNGVQVDDDNLIVNANGLVGIGTSVPTEILDVRGTAKIVGLVTAREVFALGTIVGVGTFTTITDGKIVIRSGVISASSGIITYYGDGGGLFNIPTSQWIDVDPGYGYSSIYSAGQVGIGTMKPDYWFQVGRNPDVSNGVGFNSSGDIKASGIITASSFRGPLTGTVTGNLTGNVNSTGLSTFTSVNVTGVATATRFDGNHTGILNANVNATGVSTIAFINATNIDAGIITATSFRGPITGTVTGIAQSASSLTGTPSITVANVIATSLNAGFTTTGIGTVTNTLHVGNGGTAFSALNSGRIGVGTVIPTSEFQIRKTHASLLEVISDNNRARISIGQSVGVGNSTAVLKFADTARTFDIANNDTGSLNMLLHAGGVGVNTGRFNWIYGQTNAELMSLTYAGRLGLGITNPTNKFEVVGTSTITGNAFFGGNVSIVGNLSAGTFSLPPVLDNIQINNATGISTFNDVKLLGDISVAVGASIGIGTLSPIVGLDARSQTALLGAIGIQTSLSSINQSLVVGGTAVALGVGIGTTTLSGNIKFSLCGNGEVYPAFVGDSAYFRYYRTEISLDNQSLLGIGTTETPQSAVDFANAGSGIPGNIARQMVIPKVTTTERTGILTTPGGMVYDTTLGQFLGATIVGAGRTNWINLGVQTGSVNSNQLSTIGLNVTGVSTFNTLEIGNASDTTLSRVSAGRLSIEGVNIVTASSSDILSNKTISFTSNTVSFTSAELASACSNETGSGSLVFATSPTLVNPTLGNALASQLYASGSSGIVTATNGFSSGIGTAVQITTVANQLIFTVPGVGTVALTLL
jgi:hypothetical protein